MAKPKNIPRNYKRNWTKEQEIEVAEQFGSVSALYLARKLGRGESAIIQKYQQQTGSYDLHQASGTLSPGQLAKIVGVTSRTILHWIHNFDLPADQKHKKKNDDENQRRKYYIDAEKFWKWAENNKHRINFSKIEEGKLLPEPKWLEEEIKKSKKEIPSNKYVGWTTQEQEMAWNWFKNGVHYKIIASRLGRSEKGTHNRLMSIKRKKESLHV